MASEVKQITIHIQFISLIPAVTTGTGTTWDRLITSLVCSEMHFVCRMGISILSTMVVLEGKGSSTNKGNSMLLYPKIERRRPVSQTGDVRFT